MLGSISEEASSKDFSLMGSSPHISSPSPISRISFRAALTLYTSASAALTDVARGVVPSHGIAAKADSQAVRR